MRQEIGGEVSIVMVVGVGEEGVPPTLLDGLAKVKALLDGLGVVYGHKVSIAET